MAYHGLAQQEPCKYSDNYARQGYREMFHLIVLRLIMKDLPPETTRQAGPAPSRSLEPF